MAWFVRLGARARVMFIRLQRAYAYICSPCILRALRARCVWRVVVIALISGARTTTAKSAINSHAYMHTLCVVRCALCWCLLCKIVFNITMYRFNNTSGVPFAEICTELCCVCMAGLTPPVCACAIFVCANCAVCVSGVCPRLVYVL